MQWLCILTYDQSRLLERRQFKFFCGRYYQDWYAHVTGSSARRYPWEIKLLESSMKVLIYSSDNGERKKSKGSFRRESGLWSNCTRHRNVKTYISCRNSTTVKDHGTNNVLRQFHEESQDSSWRSDSTHGWKYWLSWWRTDKSQRM